MCGRFVVSYTYDELVAMLDNDFLPLKAKSEISLPNYNVAPTNDIPVLIKKENAFHLDGFYWGYKPFHDFKNSIINIRSETMGEKNIYRHNLESNRCIIVASGFYEWKQTEFGKMPYYIHPKKNRLMLFAGIYAYDKVINQYSAAIITKDANQKMETIHDRMPLILTIENAKKWLGEEYKMVIDNNFDDITMYRVDTKINNVKNNEKSNLKEVEETPTLFTI